MHVITMIYQTLCKSNLKIKFAVCQHKITKDYKALQTDTNVHLSDAPEMKNHTKGNKATECLEGITESRTDGWTGALHEYRWTGALHEYDDFYTLSFLQICPIIVENFDSVYFLACPGSQHC